MNNVSANGTVVDPQTLCLTQSPVSNSQFEQVIQCITQKAITIIKVKGSALTVEQTQKLSDLCLEVKGVTVIDTEGDYVGGVHTNWSRYQQPQLEEDPKLRTSPRKAMELYKEEYRTAPSLAIDFGAGPGINVIALLLEGVKMVDAIDCDPCVKEDFLQNLGRLNMTSQQDQVRYHTVEFIKWEPEAPADFFIANYTWPYRSPKDFTSCWEKTLQVVRSGGYICGEFFEAPDEEKPSFTYHTREEVRELVSKECNLKWMGEVPLRRSRSSLDLQKDTETKPLPWGGLIRIVARKK